VSCAADKAAAAVSLLQASHRFGRQRHMVRPVALEVGPSGFALAAGHRREAFALSDGI